MKAEWTLCIVPVCEFMCRVWATCSVHPHHGTGWCTLTLKQLPVWMCCSDMLQMTRSCSVMSCLSHKTGRPITSAQHRVWSHGWLYALYASNSQFPIGVGFAIRFEIVNEFVEINFSDIPWGGVMDEVLTLVRFWSVFNPTTSTLMLVVV